MSDSWMLVWIFLELRSSVFIIIIVTEKTKKNRENAIKYFIIQTIASSILLISLIKRLNKNFLSSQTTFSYIIMITTTALAIKIAIAPIHSWFPKIISRITWNNSLILITIQKIIPIKIISSNSKVNIIIVFSIRSILIGTIAQINNNSIKLIMAISSINHLGWIIISSKINIQVSIQYLTIYSIIILIIIKFFNKYNNLILTNPQSKMIKYKILLIILSIAGMPPLLGFIPKWLILKNLIFRKKCYDNFYSTYNISNQFFYLYKINQQFFDSKKDKIQQNYSKKR